jgi:hypothetical protein
MILGQRIKIRNTYSVKNLIFSKADAVNFNAWCTNKKFTTVPVSKPENFVCARGFSIRLAIRRFAL